MFAARTRRPRTAAVSASAGLLRYAGLSLLPFAALLVYLAARETGFKKKFITR